MSRATSGDGWPFSPHSPELLEQVVRALSPLVTAERQLRLDAVLATRTREVVVVLEDIANEHNAAAVLRSAEAFGFFEVHVIESVARFHVSRHVASGAEKWMHIRRHRSIDEAYRELRARGYRIWSSVLRADAVPVHDIAIDEKVALVFGNEHRGLSARAAKEADGRFVVPMCGFVESLNISVAAATSCYDLASRRRQAGLAPGLHPNDALSTRAAWLARSIRSAPEVLARLDLPVPTLFQAFEPPMIESTEELA